MGWLQVQLSRRQSHDLLAMAPVELMRFICNEETVSIRTYGFNVLKPIPVSHEEEEESLHLSSQLRADQMPNPPREVQLTDDFFLDSHHHV